MHLAISLLFRLTLSSHGSLVFLALPVTARPFSLPSRDTWMSLWMASLASAGVMSLTAWTARCVNSKVFLVGLLAKLGKVLFGQEPLKGNVQSLVCSLVILATTFPFASR